VKLHVVDLFIDTALELDPCAECLEDDLRATWERFANAGWPFERLLEELLPPGPHPGFGKLKSQPGVFRCKLRPELNKAKPEHADYSGVLQLDGGKKADRATG
jgi:hypothetical protein